MTVGTAKGSLREVLIGSYLHEGRRHFLPISQAELERARVAAQRWLQTFRFPQGSNLIVSFSNEEAAHAVPFERAAISLGLVTCSVETAPNEASRVEAIVRRQGAAGAAVFNEALLGALGEIGKSPAALFQDKVLWLRPNAYRALASNTSVTCRRWLDLGPALAFECAAGEGAHVDRLEWDLACEGDVIVLTSRLPRALDFIRWRTSLRATLVRKPCKCGSMDPRLVPAGD